MHLTKKTAPVQLRTYMALWPRMLEEVEEGGNSNKAQTRPPGATSLNFYAITQQPAGRNCNN